MPNAIFRLRPGFLAAAAVLSLDAYAADHEIRIGRYQTIALHAPAGAIEAAPQLQPAALPDERATRAQALLCLLHQHGYHLHADAGSLLAVAAFLATPVPTDAQKQPAASLPLALQSLLEDHLDVLIDSEHKQVLVSISAKAEDDLNECDEHQ